jgi:hypothetical protein
LVSDWEEEEAMAAEKSACMTKSKKQWLVLEHY